MITLAVFRRFMRGRWLFLLLFVFIVTPMLWMAAALAIRSGVFAFSRAQPSGEQLRAFMTFIGGGLATTATLVATLLTSQHNRREQRRLQLETVIKTLQSLPEGEARVAGAMATMVLLGHQGIAMRALEPAWKKHKVDDGTATWLIGQVLDDERKDYRAVAEAASLLLEHAADLTVPADKGRLAWPGYGFRDWKTDLPPGTRCDMLEAMGEALVSQPKGWWQIGHSPPTWPARIFVKAVQHDPDDRIRFCASVLLDAVFSCYPEPSGLASLLGPSARTVAGDNAQKMRDLRRSDPAAAARTVPAQFWLLAEKIKDWGGPGSAAPVMVPRLTASGWEGDS